MPAFKHSVKYFILLSSLAGWLFLSSSCKKEKSYVYEVNDVAVRKQDPDKKNVKSTEEFISIIYSDLFGTNISKTKLTELSVTYAGFGDKKLIEDMIVRNFLKTPGVLLPTKADMVTDVDKFISNTYKKLFNREPGEYESWYIKDLVSKDSSITPEIIYYAMLTSNEYRYY